MVAIIKTGHSIQRILSYNEQKVKEKQARCIGQNMYPLSVNKLGLTLKLNRLIHQANLNTNVKRHSVHISLNFSPSEKLDDNKMQEIANTYMEKIGFSEQPYLVYRHLDATHPHLHIVSIKVRSDGSRIDMHNIGKTTSETARKHIEKAFDLIKAESQTKHAYKLKPLLPQIINYGKLPVKRGIQNVLTAVLDNYRYTSLPELNAILGLYNIQADRGEEHSRTFKNKGLYYRIVDADKKPVGPPIKASLFYNKPTLSVLEKKFKDNARKKQNHKAQLKYTLDKTLFKSSNSLETFKELLEGQGVALVMRHSKEGRIYGLTYVDHRSKCVFNGSHIGKNYTAKAVIDRMTPIPHKSVNQQEPQILIRQTASPHHGKTQDLNLLDALLNPETSSPYLPFYLKPKKGKKKKKK